MKQLFLWPFNFVPKVPIFSIIVTYLCLIASLFSIIPLLADENHSPPQSHYVLVSVAPHKFFVEKIAGDSVKVGLMVPAGASSHSFEPTAKQILASAKADLWFIFGEFFEKRASQALQSHNPGLRLVDLRQGLDLITVDAKGTLHSHCSCCQVGQADPHIWMSPKLAKIQAQTIAEALSLTYPQQRDFYKKRLDLFLKELDDLDGDIAKILEPLKNRTIMVSHPAYAYFARDYQLIQKSIEFEGKDPTPRQLTEIMDEARNANIKTIFIQVQYNSKGARLIAKALGANVVTIDPYSENYLDSMHEIARSFAAQETAH